MKQSVSLASFLAAAIVIGETNFANAASIVLDPGPGTNYLNYWCGGQQVNEIATGFDSEGNAVTLVKVTTNCPGSGRGGPTVHHLACWTVTFGRDGIIFSKESLGTFSWSNGHPAVLCPVSADPTAVFNYEDGAGNFPATLSTEMIGTTDRAVLDLACASIGYGETDSGTIDTPGEEPCYSFSGHAGDGLRVITANVSGNLFPMVAEVRRPDGTTLCSLGNDPINCTLDADGAHTIVIHDLQGTGTGTFEVTLTCVTPSCGAILPEPHLTIAMSASDTEGRIFLVLNYKITVGNDGDAAADDVVLTDTLPTGIYVRSASTPVGTCLVQHQAVTCSLGSLAPSATVDVAISALVPRRVSFVTNTACVNADTCVSKTSDFP